MAPLMLVHQLPLDFVFAFWSISFKYVYQVNVLMVFEGVDLYIYHSLCRKLFVCISLLSGEVCFQIHFLLQVKESTKCIQELQDQYKHIHGEKETLQGMLEGHLHRLLKENQDIRAQLRDSQQLMKEQQDKCVKLSEGMFDISNPKVLVATCNIHNFASKVENILQVSLCRQNKMDSSPLGSETRDW